MWDEKFWDITWSKPYGRYNSHHQAMWDRIVPLLSGKIVDLGCGACMIYEGKDVDLTGVDFSKQAIEEAKKNYPQGKYLVADCRDTKLPEKEFDTAVLLGLLDYFDDWEEVLKEARRLLKPKGIIIATLLNGFDGHDWTQYEHLVSNWYLFTETI